LIPDLVEGDLFQVSHGVEEEVGDEASGEHHLAKFYKTFFFSIDTETI